jgi:hypothetical protein
MEEIINEIRRHHRRRRFAMKIQQKLDRALESFLRVNTTTWHPEMEAADREKINKEIKAAIKSIRAGEPSEYSDIVKTSDEARAPADAMRDVSEKRMAKLAMELPVYKWVETVHGAGALGLATIVAEAGDLSNYSNPGKLWSRLGFAPFEGLAGSTWKRETWRHRSLSAAEWKAHPFSGQRYALMHQIVVWLVNAQWVGKAKTESGEGEPDGPYGEVYSARRVHTMTTHEDWSDGHRRMDALRFTMKRFLLNLLTEWKKEADAPTATPPQKKKRARRASQEQAEA